MSDGIAGANYERQVNSKMKKAGVQPSTFTHNPFDTDHPDAIFIKNGKTHGVEIKHVLNTSYGSCTIKHDGRKWVLVKPKAGHTIYDMLVAARVETKINQFYKGMGIPNLFSKTKLTAQERLDDIAKFSGRTTNIEISPNTAADYYTSKGVDYIQIQRYGFYYLNNNPAKINCPKFTLNRMIGEVRLKKEMRGTIPYYRFVIQIKATGNAPSRSSVDLDKSMDFLK